MGAPRPGEDEVRAATLQFLQRALPRQRTDGRWPWMVEREAMENRIEQLERELAAERAKNLAP